MVDKIVVSEKNIQFLKKVKELSGEDIVLCDQCGVCSGSCPMVAEMDITPSNLMRMVQLGIEDVMKSKTMWLCASCFACTARCPRGLDLSKVAEALRLISLRKAIDQIDIDNLSEDEIKRLPQIALVGGMRKFTS